MPRMSGTEAKASGATGQWVPTLMRHRRFASMNDRQMTMWMADEQLFSMGEATKSGVGDLGYPCLFQELLWSGAVSSKGIVKMSGDAMHMASFGYFQLYCYSRLRSND